MSLPERRRARSGEPPDGVERRTEKPAGPPEPPPPRFLPRRISLVLVLVSAALLGAGALLAVAITSIGGGVDENAATLKRIEKESLARRDQTCVIFERQAHAAARRLQATYAYLNGLTPQQARSSINQAVIRGLRDTEADARTSLAPHYCDPRGVGLPDPPATLPKRRNFSRLLVPPGT